MLGSGLNLVTTVIGFGMSATFIVFICARLICGRIRSSNSRAAALDVELRSELEQPEHAIDGLEPVVVAAIPTMKYHQDTFHSKEDAQCSICLGEYEDKEILRIMPACLHSFHRTCIDEWLLKNSTCPICRLSLNMSQFERALQAHGDDFADEHSNSWLLPTHQHAGSSDSNQVTHESISVEIPVSHREPESGT